MKALYIFLLIVLLGTFGIVLNKVRQRFRVLTPILGWMVGLSYFVLAPLTVLTLNGGFRFPDAYGLSGDWWDVDLSRPRFLFPYVVIWLSLMLTCAVVYFLCPASPHKQGSDYVISRRKLERVLRITMVLSVLDWVLIVWLIGGIAEFMVSHWYTRQDPLVERFGSVFILYMRFSLANQILFTGAAALYTGEGLKYRNTRRGFTSLILLFLLLEIVMSGNRMFFAFYLLAFLTSCWLYGRKRIIVTMLAVSPLIVLVFSAWAWVRQDVTRIPDSVGTYIVHADLGNRAVTSLMDVTDASAVMLLMRIINDYGSKYDYLYGSTYSRPFTFFYARIFHSERPPDFTAITASVYEPGADTSLGSTSLGEAFANFGFFGILVSPLFTWLVLRYSERLAVASGMHALLSAVSFIMLLSFARSTFSMNAVSLIGAALLIWVLRLERGLCVRTAAGKGLAPAGLPLILPLTPADPSP